MRQNLGSLVAIATLLMVTLSSVAGSAPRAWAGVNSPRWVLAPGDTVAGDQLIRPEKLAQMLADSTARPPAVLHVGFKFLFQSAHIPQSRYIGPASKPNGLAALRKALDEIPRRQTVVLYCGCCPWNDCPNVRPAFKAARDMGFMSTGIEFSPCIGIENSPPWVDQLAASVAWTSPALSLSLSR